MGLWQFELNHLDPKTDRLASITLGSSKRTADFSTLGGSFTGLYIFIFSSCQEFPEHQDFRVAIDTPD